MNIGHAGMTAGEKTKSRTGPGLADVAKEEISAELMLRENVNVHHLSMGEVLCRGSN